MAAQDGSSPLARGLPLLPPNLVGRLGIIPARAGFTGAGQGAHSRTGDHPRSRGVYVLVRLSPVPTFGSSPLARGLLWHRSRCLRGIGIIPARAGFTGAVERAIRYRGDHPRSRGVYTVVSCPSRAGQGSSPLARGLLDDMGMFYAIRWIIPARAGFTQGQVALLYSSWDHPRSRGVYKGRATFEAYFTGSSPLARGLLLGMVSVLSSSGIIPARAGFTRRRYFRRHQHEDHPRSRGVYGTGRVRPSRWLWRGRDHPRSRGVYRSRRLSACPRWRIIPARAGFTRLA